MGVSSHFQSPGLVTLCYPSNWDSSGSCCCWPFLTATGPPALATAAPPVAAAVAAPLAAGGGSSGRGDVATSALALGGEDSFEAALIPPFVAAATASEESSSNSKKDSASEEKEDRKRKAAPSKANTGDSKQPWVTLRSDKKKEKKHQVQEDCWQKVSLLHGGPGPTNPHWKGMDGETENKKFRSNNIISSLIVQVRTTP